MKINQDIVQFVGIIDFVFIYTKYNSGDKNQHQDILRDHVRYFHLKKETNIIRRHFHR